MNGAFMSPLMRAVSQAGIEGIASKEKPYNVATEVFFSGPEKLRKEFSELINCPDFNQIAIIPSVSYAMSTITHNLSTDRGKKIVVAGEQFPSNYYPWSRWTKENNGTLCVVSASDSEVDRGRKWNEDILANITEDTAVVALGNVHWADGTLFDLVAVREACDKHGALLVVDGTQSVGALPFDVERVRPDALICAGYKWLMGPYSIGLAYYDRSLEGMKPSEENWITREFSEDFAGLVNYKETYQPGNIRYDVGEKSNFVLVPMMTRALKQLNEWGVNNIYEYATKISEEGIGRLREAGYLIEEAEYRGGHLFGVRTKEVDMEGLSQKLRENNIFVSTRGNAVRVSVSVYNTKEDISALTDVCLSLK